MHNIVKYTNFIISVSTNYYMPILNVYDTGSTTLSAGANKCHQWLVTSAKPPSLSTSWHQICLAQGMNAPQQAVSLQNSPQQQACSLLGAGGQRP